MTVAWAKESPLGTGTQLTAGIFKYSAYPPQHWTPSILRLVQRPWFPSVQSWQLPQPTPPKMATRSLAFAWSTPVPTDAIWLLDRVQAPIGSAPPAWAR